MKNNLLTNIALGLGLIFLISVRLTIQPKTAFITQEIQTVETSIMTTPLKINTTEPQTKTSIPKASKESKKVYMLIFNPKLANNTTRDEYKTNNLNLMEFAFKSLPWWSNPYDLSLGIRNFFEEVSNGEIKYTISSVETTDVWLEKIDGFTYTSEEYTKVLLGESPQHEPDLTNYSKFIDRFNICVRANNNEFDEVWVFGYPGLGLREWFPIIDIDTSVKCNKKIYIMGFNYERSLDMAIHDFGHRMEFSMSYVYGRWELNEIENLWEAFTLIPSSSPKFDYGGCGNIHFPPNANKEVGYDYINESFVWSNCEDLRSYPFVSYIKKLINCSAWGCTHYGFLKWWFTNLPHNNSCDKNGIYNNWWVYFADLELMYYHPKSLCKGG